MTYPKRYWQDMTSFDFRVPEVKSWIAVLPIAAIEQHGPHLPTGTDRFINEGHVGRVVELLPDDLPVTFLPIMPVGKSNEHINSPGTLTYSWETLARMIIEIGDSVARAGIRKFVIVNSHGGNVAVIDMVGRELRIKHDMAVVSTAWSRFGKPEGLFTDFENRYGIHGGEGETSIMLAVRPDTVKMEHAKTFHSRQEQFEQQFKHLRIHGTHPMSWKAQDLNPDGTVGEAGLATVEKGKAAIEHSARAFIELLHDVHKFDVETLWKP